MNIGIIGLGLIGGTIAKALNDKHQISAYDISSETLDYALDQQIISKSYTDLSDFLKDNKIIYLCLYPDLIVDFFKNNLDLIQENTVFIEISGIKTSLIKAIAELQINHFEIVYTHPIAGSEKIGVKYADKNIFNKANYAIIETPKNTKTNIKLAESLAKEMNFKNISIISAETHDEIIAYTSQLTHVISLALVNAFKEEINLTKFSGDSYRDLTRIANINTSLWPELFFNNQENLIEKIEDFEKSLAELKKAIATNNQKDLVDLMTKAKNLHNDYFKVTKNEG